MAGVPPERSIRRAPMRRGCTTGARLRRDCVFSKEGVRPSCASHTIDGGLRSPVASVLAPTGSTVRRALLLYRPAKGRAGAIDVNGEESWLRVGGRRFGLLDEGPDDLSVGIGNRKPVDLVEVEPVEPALPSVLRHHRHLSHYPVVEKKPVSTPLESGFRDQPNEAQSLYRNVDSRLFLDLPLGALCRGFAGVDVEFPSDRRAESEVWRLDAPEQQKATLAIAQIAETGDPVGKRGRRPGDFAG